MAELETGTGPDKPTTPWWAWLFVAACVAIPITSLGGAIPGAIGGGGAFACYSVAKTSPHSPGVRAAICTGIAALCWVLFVVFIVVVAMMTAK